MNLSELINEILSEWAYRVDDGMPNAKNPIHLKELGIILSEMGLSHIKNTLVENLLTEKGKTPEPVKEEEGSFSNPILNKKIKYKNTKGEDKEGLVGNLLRLPAEHPGRKAAEALLPADGSDERDALNKDLGGQGQPTKPEDGKDKEGGEAAGGEEDKAKAAQAMFDPKNDPAMAARMDKEKEVQAQLAKDAEADKEAEKEQEPKEDSGFNPIDTKDVAKEMPNADPETFNGDSDIPDGIDSAELEKFNTDISKVKQIVDDAKTKGEKAPNINLCQITVPGTNLYCDDNLGIPREEMPQFKGKPQPGTPAADMPVDKNGEVDTEPLFKKMLEEKGVKVVQTEVPSDKLKATQSELVGAKVVGMMDALEEDPENEALTAPIYVSRDGFVIDGHHRWAAIAAYNAKHPDKQIPMKVQVIDMDIKDAIPMCNKFAEEQGVAAKKADANKETPTEQPSEPAKREPANNDPESKAQQFKGKSSGENIQTMEMEGGGFVYGTKHGNTAMVDDILDDVKSKIPKERWGDIVFVGEGGATNDEGDVEFNDEMDYAAPKFKELGASVDTWDGDEMDVHNDQSKLYQKQKEKTGFNDSQVKAGNWASMIGQGEGTDTMSPNDYLDDEGKQFLQDAAKEAGFPPIENWDEPTEQDKDTLYRLSFPEDNGDKPTKINDIQVAFNEIRDENLIEKNKELTAQGKIPITIAGESHVELVDKMTRKGKETSNSASNKKLPEPEQPSEKDGGVVYSLGGGYYSDKPNGPAQYMASESVVEKVLIEGDINFSYLLFEASVTKTTSKGNTVKLITIDPKNQNKATAAAAAATSQSTDNTSSEPQKVTSTPNITDKIKQKISKWSESEKEYFKKGYYKAGSEPRRTLAQTLRDKASGAWQAVKDGFKHEVHEFKTAGVAVGKLFSEAGGWNDLSHHEKDALKAVGIKIVTTALFGAAFGGLAHGGVAFAKHVAIEFVPHVVAETFLKGAGRAALFADAEGEAEMDAKFVKFAEMIADGLENMKISPEQMDEMIDSYNKKKVNGEDQPEITKEQLKFISNLMLEMVNRFIDEAKPKASTEKFQAISKQSNKVVDFKSKEARDAAVEAGTHTDIDGNDKSTNTVAGAGMYDDDYAKNRASTTSASKNKKVDDTKELDLKKVEKLSKELYGNDGKGALLQNSPTSDSALKNGYTEGEWWVAPGNAGSNFNENMSNEAACILKKHPDLTEEELAMILFRKANGTKLGAQQANPATKSKNKIKVPPGLSKEEQILYKNCVITARSGRAKYDRAFAGVEECKKQFEFGEIESVVGYGGTSRKSNTPEKVKTDRENMLAEVDSANNCYIYDDETGKVYKIEKEDLKKWIKSSGGGENAADTVVLTKDKNGNLLYDGWSDKKTLGDLQANGTLYNDMIQSGIRVQEMINSGQIDKKDAAKAKKIIDDGANEIKLIERGYSTIASSHSKYFLGVLKNNPREFKKMEEQAASNPETKKHYKNWTDTVKKITDGRGASDAKSVAIAEEISGSKRKKSKEEIAADKFIQDTLDKYGEDTVATLLKNPDIDESVKKEVKKAEDAGKKGRKEYMNKFNNEWLTDPKNKTKIKSISPFALLNNVQIKYPSVVSENERKVIDRTATLERQKYINSGEKIPPTLNTQNTLEIMRKKAFSVQRGIFEKLSKIKAKTTSGKPTNAAAVLGFKDSVAALHLDKIILPKDENDIKQILRRSTNLVMEGVRVSPKNIKECLGVDDINDLENNFVVDFTTDKFITNADGNVTGKTIAIYLVDKNNQRREISPKVYRPKTGPTGKTANTLAWSDDMQKCFDSKK